MSAVKVGETREILLGVARPSEREIDLSYQERFFRPGGFIRSITGLYTSHMRSARSGGPNGSNFVIKLSYIILHYKLGLV